MKKILILLLLFACNSFNYSYFAITDFKLKSNEERNGKEVQLLYTSSFPSDFKDRNAYIHFIGFISETNDTFNILSPMAQSMQKDELDTKFILYTKIVISIKE